MATLPKVICRFNAISIKSLMSFFIEREKNHKIYMESQIAKTIMSKKNKARGITVSGFKIYYKAIETKTV